MWNQIRATLGLPLRMHFRRQANRFWGLLKNPRDVQRQILFKLLRLNGSSEFGREHGLHNIKSVSEFRKNLQVCDYEFYRPWIERLKEGKTDALLGEKNKLLMFALTSGTTSGAKFIPITSQFMTDYRRGWRVWGIKAYDAHPQLFTQHIVQLASNHDQFRSPGGTPCGNISGLVMAMQSLLVRSMYTVPNWVAKIGDPEAKYYAALRTAYADREVGMVMTANPSTLVHLARLGNEHAQNLIRDIHEGTMTSPVPGPLPKVRFSKNPRRARELERILQTEGKLTPKSVWPDLSLIAVWQGGSASAYLPGLKEWYGEIPTRDHGLSASEGRMTIPSRDGTAAGVLDIASHFFEFIPVEEADAKQPTVLEAHELEQDREYLILLTTSSGLYRYNIYDVVRCVGFEQATPLLEFRNKGAHIASLTGEKLSEFQVVQAVRESSLETGVSLSYYTLTPRWGDPPGYLALIEAPELPVSAREEFARILDRRLGEQNSEYREKRQTGRLLPLRIETFPPGTWKRFIQSRQTRLGGSVEQYKHPCLAPKLEFYDEFVQLVNGP